MTAAPTPSASTSAPSPGTPGAAEPRPATTAGAEAESAGKPAAQPPLAFFGWVDAEGSVFLYDGLLRAPTRKRVGLWRMTQVSGRTCVVVERGPHRWLAISDWPLPEAPDSPARVLLFKRDPAKTAKPRR